MEELIKIAEERFEAGHAVAYIPLAGDPERTRNFAGIWIVKNRAFSVRLVGRLLGQNVETSELFTESLGKAIERGLIIWDSYKFDGF